MSMYTITRQICIDAGHRIPWHGSKCKNPHGHRYVIEATCGAKQLHETGEQTGMVLDFSFLKAAMIKHIDEPCDHGFMVHIDDSQMLRAFLNDRQLQALPGKWESAAQDRFISMFGVGQGEQWKLYIIDKVPTAENLAEHWFNRLTNIVKQDSLQYAELLYVDVHETPNCMARYPVTKPKWMD